MAILIVMALSWLSIGSVRGETPVATMPSASSPDSITVSLITCYPGPEVYELCGHEAIRVRGEGRDSVWNYGVFDFRAPNFLYRFVKGETDYICAGYPFAWFLPEYQGRGSKVVEQDLNLTQAEARKLLALLQTEALPQNRVYRYNYVKDNCATRILDRIEDSSTSRILYPDTVTYGSFRNEMRAYHKDYPWYQFGIDIALGAGIDYPLTPREEMFVPVEMMRKAAGAKMLDGRNLVKETRILNEGVADATLGPTPFYFTPLFVAWVLAILLAGVCLFNFLKKRLWRWAYALWFSLLGIAGCVVWFLVFVSTHEATSPNTLLMWLSPVQLVTAAAMAVKRLRAVGIAMAWYNIVAMVCTLVVWPFQHQQANPAFFPLMGITLLMAVTFAVVSSHGASTAKMGETPASGSGENRRTRKPQNKIRVRKTKK